jgi:hypothetical protein
MEDRRFRADTVCMKRAILALIVTGLLAGLPAAVAAQEPAQTGIADTDAAAPATPSPDSASQRNLFARQKPRPSMVGYIDDAIVGSAFRTRYDSAWDMDSPDRAELFYGKCGCYRSGIPALDPSAPGPGPGVVASLNSRELSVITEKGGQRVSVFMELPFRWIDPTTFVAGTGSFSSQSGLGDIRVGTKVAIASTNSLNITAMVRGSIPTGDSTKGLGTDHGTVEPAVLVRQTLGSRIQIEGMFGDTHPTGSSKGPEPGDGDFAGDILYYGIGPSFDVVSTRNTHFAPVVELVGWHVLSGFQTSTVASPTGFSDASGLNIVDLKVGARLATANGSSFYVGYGWALTGNVWNDHALRLEYRKKL